MKTQKTDSRPFSDVTIPWELYRPDLCKPQTTLVCPSLRKIGILCGPD